MRGPEGYFRSAEMSSHQFIKTVHEKWRNRLHATSKYELDLYSEQVKRCIEIALSCLEADRSKRPSIGDIVKKLNETEVMLRFGHALANGQGSSKLPMNQMRFGNVVCCHDKDSSCHSNEHGAHYKDVSFHNRSSVCQDNDRGCRDWGVARQNNTNVRPDQDSTCRDNEGDCCDKRAACYDNKNDCHDNEGDLCNRAAPCNNNNDNNNGCRDKDPMCHDNDIGCHKREFGWRGQR